MDTDVEPDVKLDVTGEVCPMPAADTRKTMRNLSSGQILEVVGDFECAAENIRNMAEKNGGEVLTEETAKNYFRVVIKKL
ncbi:MAG TPA: sulfurtransferase TusA family protein [Candidatus Lokiarchaeia archaeon]|nr:sulfurtransferase TusA family protein [Candidatus Lokiarchaeia archaeon]